MKGASTMDGAPRALLARALYDNRPDCCDELAFCRGDILTILERNVPESEGWWRCSLHGRQGLAPANRLQVLTEAPADRPWPPSLAGLEEALASPKETYRVPTLLGHPPPSPVYEHMKSWVEGTSSPTVQVYELPDPPAGARAVCETVLGFPKQAILSIPRPAPASSPVLYDVPAKNHCPPALKEPEKQQLYDIPASPRKAGRVPAASSPSRQSAPVTSAVAVRRACYKTLPNPQKSEWIYDTPVSPEKAEVRNASPAGFVDKAESHALPRPMTGFHCPLKSRARSLTPHLSGTVPTQKKLSLPETPAHCVPAPKAATPSEDGGGYRVPSNFLIPRVEQQNTRPNIYDVPKARPSALPAAEELEKGRGAPKNEGDCGRAWAPQQTSWLCPELDRLSVNSADSRVSVVSSCSSTSTDSSSGSSSEESAAKEPPLDLDLAKGLVTALQHRVASSVSGLMLFVSRTWRLRDHLEANIDAIRRATDHIEEALREFLEFAHGVCGAACHLTDSNLQAKIRNQLQTICGSYQALLESKQSLDGCHWSLEVLVTDKAQNSPDDLERFVMVARMVPEDIKRFASMVIANGRLLFKQNGEKRDAVPSALGAGPKLASCVRLPQREVESYQRSAPTSKQRESGLCPELLEKNWTNARGKKLPHLEEEVKPILEQRSDGSKGFETQNAKYPMPRPPGQQHPEKKVHLSEHCRLYFGALFKAIGVFHSSLRHGQSPEIFIAQSKLVIMIGQKLVDTLCRETQDRDVRNEILCGSSHLCSLLKNLALATKHAVLQYPSPEALGHLQAEAEKLEQHTRQFRGTLE
ncbi:Cas scaffold protein family member 4 [Phyllostomus discolor]|uniref:Cas scaffolding protein family member 4 n=2 Tax=Phyllostomus discolor TaxID=89673 RepID=A0A6J2ML36_9CHIR|nr:cas scaffolding protein family member 4 [Phyllostomus discolor]KAF6087509.1 Cas scaffold protein family member 4 [Phyllostomus discolor]